MWCVQFWICFTGHWIFLFFEHYSDFRGISAETYFLGPKLGGYSGFRGANWEMYFDIYYLGCFIYILLPIMEKYESRILLLIFEVGF